MKKILFCCGIIALYSGATIAAEKCVALNEEASNVTTTCTRDSNFVSWSDWYVTCSTTYLDGSSYVTTEDFVIKGIAQCSHNSNSTIGAVKDKINTIASNSAENDKFCYCKMVSPAVSKWVYAHTYGDHSNCSYNCPARCTDYLTTDANANYMKAMFSNLSD